MKTVLTRDVTVHQHNLDGKTVPVVVKKGSVVVDLKEPKTGTFTALLPDHGRRVTFDSPLDINCFEEVED